MMIRVRVKIYTIFSEIYIGEQDRQIEILLYGKMEYEFYDDPTISSPPSPFPLPLSPS